jgi:uncharacterized protein (DUF1697 family)
VTTLTSYVALLRAINVGGRNVIPMAALRALCVDLGFAEPRTLLQSGNVVFRTALPRATIAPTLAAGIERHFGFSIDVIVRSASEWTALIEANPFPREAIDDPAHLVVMCCTSAPNATALAALDAAIVGREAVRASGAQVYLVYPDGIGNSRLTNAVIEKHLATNGTARNWNTVTKVAALLRGE